MAKVLIVDDDPLMVRMYQAKLQDDGNQVEIADDGQAGLQKVTTFHPDLIVLDVMMPNISGLDMLKKLKENEKTKKIPVILLTNVDRSDADIQRGLDLGAVAYLVKAQYRPDEIIAKIKEILLGYVQELPKVKAKIKA